MPSLKDQAVALRRLDFSETSQVLVMFTRRHGKLRCIAKGIKRSTKVRFAASIDLLDVGDLVVSVRHPGQEELAIVTEWTQTRMLGELRARLDRLYGAQYAAGLTTELTEDWDPHPSLFDDLLEVLEGLASAPDTLPLVVAFQRKLLQHVGSVPITDHCIGCRRPVSESHEIYFSSLEGGLLCRDCEPARVEKRSVDPRAISWLRGRVGQPLGLRPAFAIFDYHVCNLIGRRHPLGVSYLATC